MDSMLALTMDDAKAWGVLIGGIFAGLAAFAGVIINGIQGYANSQKLDHAKARAEESEIKIDKTLKNTNGGMHSLRREVAALKEEVRSLKSQNVTLRHDAGEKQKERFKRKTPTK